MTFGQFITLRKLVKFRKLISQFSEVYLPDEPFLFFPLYHDNSKGIACQNSDFDPRWQPALLATLGPPLSTQLTFDSIKKKI